ncbi:hypothetical protein HYH02_012952 [Chlamydomonas schloesseri]|uniref:WW domain-containing protein n=1 Tax=Chlamydomonas schloesseri TaxID=2026947 RepID=A0A835T648_9CHLO|nr:hypothetical protein HYH02_012952 [Chlamydomonas schloesseri]|eukprot:KAG2432380.1 hypothetical protein HYH02_012952 [Chlamydomonas schloesseri]
MSARDRDKRLGGSRMMRKAEALGLETRNVANSYLLPVLRSSSASAGTGGTGLLHTATASSGGFHETQQWSANMSPKALTALRTTRMLQSLGQKVIFSNDPYVNSAFESLLTTKVSGVPSDIAPELAELIARRAPPGGRLRPRGSKAAALKRAKRLVGAGALPAASEVPFSDALRVCDLERDKSALPTLLRAYIFNKARVIVPKLEEYCDSLGRQRPAPMLQAAALLMQHGYFFAAIKVVYSNFEALQATLSEMESLVSQHMATEDWDTAAALWNWKDPDRELFLKQFKELKIITYYLDVRKQLRALKDQGVVALCRVEREMLLKVIQDFKLQLQEDYAAHQAQLAREAEERARAQARMEAQARAAAEAAARRAEEAARVEARARAAAETKAKREADMREKAREMDRKREEVRKRAEENKRAGGAGRKAGPLGAGSRGARGPGVGAEHSAMADAAAALFEEGTPMDEDGPLVDPDADGEGLEGEASVAGMGTGSGEAAAAAAAAAAAGGEVPLAESSEAIIAAEAGDTVPELGAGARSTPGGSRQGSRPGSATVAAADGAAAGAAATEEGGEGAGAEGAEESGDPSRPPVRVHLRPGSRGLKMALSMDGEAPPGPEAEELRRGIEDMKRAMSEERKRSEEAAAQLKALSVAGSGSRPATASSSSAPLPAIRLNINLTAGTTDEKLKEMEAALEAERAEFQRRLEEERAAMAAVLAEEKSKLEDHLNAQKKLFDEERQRLLRDMYEQQGADIDQQLAASALSIEALKAQRDRLKSANGSSRNTSGRNAAQAEEAARLEAAVKMLEKKLDDELSHVRQLEEEKGRVEAERTALEAAQRMLEAQKSQAELEKAKAEQEKGALQEQIAKTMRMFQEQLAQTVKMAAMLQAQRILGAATGGAAPQLQMGPMGPMATPLGTMGGGAMPTMGGGAMGLVHQGSAGSMSMGPGHTMSMSMGLPGSAGMGLPGSAGMAAMGGLSGLPGTPSMGGGLVGQGSMGGAAAAAAAAGGMLPAPAAPTEADDPPTQEEIVAYGKYLGMDVVEDADLLHIAEWALTAPLPEGWTVHLDGEGNEFFYNAATNASTYEHPMDEHYRAYYRKMKEQKQLAKMAEAQQAAAGGGK